MTRFMLVMIRNKSAAAAADPDAQDLASTIMDSDALIQGAVLHSFEALHPASKGARISFSRGTPKVTEGPFTEAKELLGGCWMIEVRSKEEALAWVSRWRAQNGDSIEIRRMFEISDFAS